MPSSVTADADSTNDASDAITDMTMVRRRRRLDFSNMSIFIFGDMI